MAGLYKIFNKVKNLYKVKLLNLVKVHFIFLPDKLQKAAINFLLEQVNPPPLLVQVNGEDEWEIKEILAYRLIRGTLKYCISWKGYNLDLT